MEDTKMKTAVQKDLKAVATKLNTLLASYQIYYQNLRGFHWNIQGKNFFILHEKFEEFYNNAAEVIDEIAERMLAMDEKPMHTYEDYLNESKVKQAKNVNDSERAVSIIADNLQTIIRLENEIVALADNANDMGTDDMLTGFIKDQEETLWMLRAFLR